MGPPVNGTELAPPLGTWTTSQCPFAIEYAPEALEGIRIAVVAAFHRLSRGGLEIGGILLGSCSTGRVTITDFRPLECEHAFGPSFRLSDNDHSRLSESIAGAQAAGQTVVGWFHSHTRTAIFLSEADLEIYNRHFNHPINGPRQVALVLKPIPQKPTLCGFFFREDDGSIHSEESYQEFELESRSANEGHARASSPQRDEQALNAPLAPQSSRKPREPDQLPQTPPQPALEPPPMDNLPKREAASASLGGSVPQPWRSPKRAQQRRQSSGLHFHWGRAMVGVTVLLALGATYAYLTRPDPRAQTTGAQPVTDPVRGVQPVGVGQQPAVDRALGLRIQRQGTDLALTWNRTAPDVQNATGGLLSIKDGPKRKEIGLSSDQLRSANILFAPESDHVEVQLTVLLPNQRIASESGIAILPGQSLPGQRYAGPVVLKPTVPSSTYTGAQVRLGSREAKASKVFVAPPTRIRVPDTRPMEQPPAPKGIESQARIPFSGIAPFRTASNLPPAPAPELARTEPPAVPSVQTSPGSASPSGPSVSPRVGGNAQPAELISRINPIYPFAARAGHMQGIVVLEGVIGTNGQVKQVTVISGHQVFRKAAVAAVSQWAYKPAILNGKTVEAQMRVEIHFREGM